MVETQCLQHSKIPRSSSEDLCPEEHTQRHHQHYLASMRTSPDWRGKGAYFALFLLLKTVFCSKFHNGETQYGCKLLKVLTGRSTASKAALPNQDFALLCWNRLHAIACKCWGPDLTVNCCVYLPCPAGPCHQTGKVCLCLFFRIPLAHSAASSYPPAPESSAGASVATEQLVIPALGYVVKWDRHFAVQDKEDTSFRETAFQNKN